jgi:hypothetical protein
MYVQATISNAQKEGTGRYRQQHRGDARDMSVKSARGEKYDVTAEILVRSAQNMGDFA